MSFGVIQTDFWIGWQFSSLNFDRNKSLVFFLFSSISKATIRQLPSHAPKIREPMSLNRPFGVIFRYFSPWISISSKKPFLLRSYKARDKLPRYLEKLRPIPLYGYMTAKFSLTPAATTASIFSVNDFLGKSLLIFMTYFSRSRFSRYIWNLLFGTYPIAVYFSLLICQRASK